MLVQDHRCQRRPFWSLEAPLTQSDVRHWCAQASEHWCMLTEPGSFPDFAACPIMMTSHANTASAKTQLGSEPQGRQNPASRQQLVVQPTANAWARKICLISSPTPSYTTGYTDPVHALRERTASRDRQRTAKGSASRTAMTSLGIAMASLAKTLWRSTGNCRRLQQLKGPNRLTTRHRHCSCTSAVAQPRVSY